MRFEFNINFFEKKIYSQNGEDGIIQFIFGKIGITNKFFVEFGVGHGIQCNTRYLRELGWDGLSMDSAFQSKLIKKEIITAENIEKLFKKYEVPKKFDLLSIDIDYNDYWVWKSIVNYSPNIVIIEYNSSHPPNQSKVVPYNPNGFWDRTNFFGASLRALKNLGDSKGYQLIGCDSMGINAFFCKKELAEKIFPEKNIEEIFMPPKYGRIVNGKYQGHPPSDKNFVEI
ncbi:MAG: FkbM family methyltransferase [Nitrosopumilus sp.]|nr:FkbM family methyltransferase [Nitrosopumilus sp.]